jgi:hypothetical protein
MDPAGAPADGVTDPGGARIVTATPDAGPNTPSGIEPSDGRLARAGSLRRLIHFESSEFPTVSSRMPC